MTGYSQPFEETLKQYVLAGVGALGWISMLMITFSPIPAMNFLQRQRIG